MNVDLASSDTISLGGLGKETEFDRRKKKKSVLLSLNYDLHNSCMTKRSETEFGLNRPTFQNVIWGKQPNEKKRSKKLFYATNFKIKIEQVNMLQSFSNFQKLLRRYIHTTF